jgi:thioredoxin 1
MTSTKAVTDVTFAAEVLESDVPVVVDFWAPWCGPCRLVAPVLEELSKEYAGRVKVVSLNSDENPVVTGSYGVLSLPTINFYAGGELVRSLSGARPKQALAREFEALLADVAAG